jgi:hypothetical protein
MLGFVTGFERQPAFQQQPVAIRLKKAATGLQLAVALAAKDKLSGG